MKEKKIQVSCILVLLLLLIGSVPLFTGAATKIISHSEEWITPFDSVETTIYDLGDGFTSTVTTTTTTKISSVRHSDKSKFSVDQTFP